MNRRVKGKDAKRRKKERREDTQSPEKEAGGPGAERWQREKKGRRQWIRFLLNTGLGSNPSTAICISYSSNLSLGFLICKMG